jgi:hypothetical protein
MMSSRMIPPQRSKEYKRRFSVVAYTKKWAVIMTKVRIRQVVAASPWPRWHLLTFTGPNGSESRGIVDMVAIRKDHGDPPLGTKRGDLLDIILIQVKGGCAARPTAEDCERMRIVARHHNACRLLLATWEKGTAVRFFSLRKRSENHSDGWVEVSDLREIFG